VDNNLALEARNMAGQYFREGYNCAESIILTYSHYFAPQIVPDTVKMVTGFGCGLGHAGCMCGALLSSVMVLNSIKGRNSIKEDRNAAYETAHEFHDLFRDKFGSTCCRSLK
jgi:C_GCAxxG_C_C family probable redox protein